MHSRRAWPLAAAIVAAAAALASTPEAAQAQRRCRVTEVTVAPPSTEFQVGAQYPFTATAYDAAGNPCENPAISWFSSNTRVATIDAGGMAHGVGAGTATITARVGTGPTARSGTAAVTVTEAQAAAATGSAPPVPGYNPKPDRPRGTGWAAADRQPDGTGNADNLFVDPLQLSLVRGESRYLDFKAIRADGQNASAVPIVFSVDPGGDNIIAVDTFGLVISRGDAGAATVRLSIPGQVRIQPKLVRVEVRSDTLRFNRTTLSLAPGQVETLSVFIPQQSRAINPGGLFQFASSDETILRVNPAQPIIEARAPGTARVIAQSGLYTDISATVYVHRRVASLRVEGDSTRLLAIGSTTTVRAAAFDSAGAVIAEAPLTWRAPDTTVASFDPATGTVRARRSGEALITVFAPSRRDEALSRTVRIRVVAGGLAIARTRVGLNVGDRLPLDVQLLDDQRRVVMSANQFMTWRSSADTVATVDSNRIVARHPGHARIAGRTPWDSTVSVDVVVGGDMITAGQRAGRYDLTLYWGGTANWMPLTQDSLIEAQPAWSPDLTKVAFAANLPTPPGNNRNVVPRSSLAVMNVDGSERAALTDDSALVRYPSWVRGGQKIVFEWNKTSQAQVWIYEFPASGTGPGTSRQISTTPVPNMAPAVNPAGDRVVYVSVRQTSPGRTTYGLFTAALDGSDERPLAMVPQGQRIIDQPAWSPDGRSVFFVRSEQGRPPAQRVYRMPVGGAPTDTAVAVTPAAAFVRSFSLNHDGTSMMLSILEAAPNNRQVARLVSYTLGAAAVTPAGTPPDEEVTSAALRPAAPPPPAANR